MKKKKNKTDSLGGYNLEYVGKILKCDNSNVSYLRHLNNNLTNRTWYIRGTSFHFTSKIWELLRKATIKTCTDRQRLDVVLKWQLWWED